MYKRQLKNCIITPLFDRRAVRFDYTLSQGTGCTLETVISLDRREVVRLSHNASGQTGAFAVPLDSPDMLIPVSYTHLMTISNVSYALKIHFGSRYCYPDTIGHPGTASNEEALRIRTMWKDDTNEQSYLRLPPISLTTEESEERADIMIQVDTYCLLYTSRCV